MKELTGKLLKKADRAIHASDILMRERDADSAAGRAYYAMFYTAEALLSETGLKFRKHGGVHGAFGEHFVKKGLLDAKYHQWLLDAFDKRIQSDYGVDTVVTVEDVARMLEQARAFLQEARRYLGVKS